MVKVEKRFNKKHLYIVITSAILVLLSVAYIVINSLFNSGIISPDKGDDTPKVTFDESIGESHYLGTPTVYPYISKNSITKIKVDSHARQTLEDDTVIEDFIMQKPQEKDSGNYLSYFIFRYKDKDSGKYIDYMPSITYSGEEHNYENLYAVEASDGLGATKIEYFCAMVGALYFQTKVDIDPARRDAQLKTYGLDADSRETITVDYLDADGKAQSRRIYIGDKLITGIGYYFMLEGREIIYASAQSERLNYALLGFEKLVASRIVAQSYGNDGTFEPYLTTGYKQWKNTYFGETGTPIRDGSLVTFSSMLTTPNYEAVGGDGYSTTGYYEENMLNLESVKTSYRYAYIRKALLDMRVGEEVNISSTVLADFLEAELYDGEKGTGNYTYYIREIEAVFTADGAEITAPETPVLGATRVKVAYDVYLDGEQKNSVDYHAVIDLENAKALPLEAREAILSSKIGTLTTPITYSTRYIFDEANPALSTVNTKTVSYKIVSINQICKIVNDGEGERLDYQEKIDGTSVVYMSVCYVLTDVDGTVETLPESEIVIDLSKITEGDDLRIKNAILGMGAGECNKTVELGRRYYQDMQSFELYDIKSAVGFMKQSLVSAFKFINESDKNDFYAESTYANILGELEPGHKYSDYAMNVENCDRVVRILGGISNSGNSQSATGLVGSETVAVGLTSEVMRKYKLYEGHTVSFGLPRGIDESPANSEDFIWDHELTFTLYISPVQYGEGGEKFYYIGSDMYDTVVRLETSELDYLDYSFAEFWARRNMVMISSENLDKIELSFNMTNLYGDYAFDIEHETIYIGSDGQHYPTKPESGGSSYDFISVIASIVDYEEGKSAVEGKYTETELSKYLTSLRREKLNLADLYNRVAGIKPGGMGLTVGHDTAGTAYYKEMLMVMFSTYYMGVLSADEIAVADAKQSLMKIAFTVKSSSVIYKYVYEFKRLDARRIMVSTYREDYNGVKTEAVNDFYITDFAFDKIVSAYRYLLSGKAFDADTAYGD